MWVQLAEGMSVPHAPKEAENQVRHAAGLRLAVLVLFIFAVLVAAMQWLTG